MATLDEITKEKERVNEALARVDAEREKVGRQHQRARSSNAWLPGRIDRRADAQPGEPDLRMSRKLSRGRRYRSRWQPGRLQLLRLRSVACEGAEYPSCPAKPAQNLNHSSKSG